MNVLFLTHRLPFAPNRGDRIRAFHILRTLKACANVSLVSLVHDAEEESQATSLRDLAADVFVTRVPHMSNRVRAGFRLLGRRPVTLELLYASTMYRTIATAINRRPPDVVLAYCSGMARFAMEPPLRALPFVLDMVDVDSSKWRALSLEAGWPKRLIYRRESVCLARFERQAIEAAAATVVVNQREADSVRALVPDAPVHVVQNGIDLESFSPPGAPVAGTQVVFCGVLDYGPNETAALRLAREIWPLVRQARPDARLVLVGARPTAAIRKLPSSDPTVHVTGAVDDVRPFLWKSAVAAVPLRTARGLQNKVLEALAAGLPAVISRVVADGLPEATLAGCLIADSNEEFARTIVELLGMSPGARRERAASAPLAGLGWNRQLIPLFGILSAAAATRQARDLRQAD